MLISFFNFFPGIVDCQRLQILPVQSEQTVPIGKTLLLTCRPDVPDVSLVTDLQWRDNQNMTVLAKQ